MSIELELKALVENPTELQAKIESKYDMTNCTKVYSEQLNHYFNGDKEALLKLSKFYEFLPSILKANTLAVRTRWDSVQGTLLIVKYSLIDENSDNGTIRKELEFNYPNSLSDLDTLLLECGYSYQSKWSRKRTQYNFETGWTICVDFNAGYQGLVEVEYVATEEEYNQKKDYLMYKAKTFLDTLGLVELKENLLTEMFNFYSQHFDDFYGKDVYIWDDSRFPYTRTGQLKPSFEYKLAA